MENDIHQRIKELFLANHSRLTFHARSILGNDEDADDVVGDVFFELWNKRETVNLDHGVNTYLYRAVTNKALNMLRRRQISGQYFEAINEITELRMEFVAEENSGSDSDIERAELARDIKAAIESLPDKCRQAFILSYLHDMKNADIAEIMQVSVRTVDAHIYRGLRMLRERLKYLLSLLLFFNLY